MISRTMGTTGERVSAIGLGCMGMVGWYGTRDDEEAEAPLHRALELGVTHLDTAAVYQDGDNERFVGAGIRGFRDRVFLATKCGMARSPEGRIAVDNRPETIRNSCDESLHRLGTDYIDLFYLHRIDPNVPIAESMGAMADLVELGKIRYVGLSEATPDKLREAHGIHPVTALQSELSLWTRASASKPLEVCRELGVAFVAYSPLGRGFLTGRIQTPEDIPDKDTRRMFPRFSDDNFSANRTLALKFGALAEEKGCTPAQLAIAWVLAQWKGVLPIPGTKKRRYLEENLAAAQIELTNEERDAIESEFPEDAIAGERYPAAMMGNVNA